MKINPELILHEETLPGGWNRSFILRRGKALRLTDPEGGANVSALFYNARNTTERYNMPDTLKSQFISCIGKGCACYSDMGRILVSVINDSCGHHDTISGVSNAKTNLKKYGTKSYQETRNDYLRNGFDSFLVELAKHGMGKRDFVPPVNFFTKVDIDDAGDMSFVPGNSRPDSFVDLQAEMDTLVILNTCPHPLDPSPEYNPKPVGLTLWKAEIPAAENPCFSFCPQNERGFRNTAEYHL